MSKDKVSAALRTVVAIKVMEPALRAI